MKTYNGVTVDKIRAWVYQQAGLADDEIARLYRDMGQVPLTGGMDDHRRYLRLSEKQQTAMTRKRALLDVLTKIDNWRDE